MIMELFSSSLMPEYPTTGSYSCLLKVLFFLKIKKMGLVIGNTVIHYLEQIVVVRIGNQN